jgi:hypothetical protein
LRIKKEYSNNEIQIKKNITNEIKDNQKNGYSTQRMKPKYQSRQWHTNHCNECLWKRWRPTKSTGFINMQLHLILHESG